MDSITRPLSQVPRLVIIPGRRPRVANNGQMIVDLDKMRMQAMASKDIATLDALLADDLV
jgi:hypothetical protein